jgi:hypothetical protein
MRGRLLHHEAERTWEQAAFENCRRLDRHDRALLRVSHVEVGWRVIVVVMNTMIAEEPRDLRHHAIVQPHVETASDSIRRCVVLRGPVSR